MKVSMIALAAAAVLGAALLAGCGLVPTNQSALQPMTDSSANTSRGDPSTTPTAPQDTTTQTPPPAATNPTQQPTTGSHHNSHHGGSIGTTTVALSEQDAVDIALEHARVAQTDTVFLQVEGDRDDGRYLYEVEFYVGPVEYKYEIDANTGTILEFETEKD